MPDNHEMAAAPPDSQRWVVVALHGSFTTCYGLFHSYEDCTTWTRANGWHPADVHIYSVRAVNSADEETQVRDGR